MHSECIPAPPIATILDLGRANCPLFRFLHSNRRIASGDAGRMHGCSRYAFAQMIWLQVYPQSFGELSIAHSTADTTLAADCSSSIRRASRIRAAFAHQCAFPTPMWNSRGPAAVLRDMHGFCRLVRGSRRGRRGREHDGSGIGHTQAVRVGVSGGRASRSLLVCAALLGSYIRQIEPRHCICLPAGPPLHFVGGVDFHVWGTLRQQLTFYSERRLPVCGFEALASPSPRLRAYPSLF
ncbi:hypothetical protein FB451DRAFT_1375219 [Mycena latifolia]|nr:hypothetical protein FB451DRAFT_1375219 [Mycena latifolia]